MGLRTSNNGSKRCFALILSNSGYQDPDLRGPISSSQHAGTFARVPKDKSLNRLDIEKVDLVRKGNVPTDTKLVIL